MEIYSSKKPSCPYAIPNSHCYYCSTFQTHCAYCVSENKTTYLQMDCTRHDNCPYHLQLQTYITLPNGKTKTVCHCHLCYWNQPPTTEELNSAIKKAEYELLSPK